jgi:hypothetical protein
MPSSAEARRGDHRTYAWSFTDAARTLTTGHAHLGKAMLLDQHLGPWCGHLDIDDDSDGSLTALPAFDVATRS